KAGEGAVDVQCLRKLRGMLEEAHETDPREFAAILYGKPFDYMIVDCPPAFNAASAAALIAADAVLIPVKLDAFALEGMTNLLQQIANMRKLNPKLRVLGVLPVMWYRSETIVKAESALRNAGLKVLPRIRRSDRVDDMTYAQAPLIVCSPHSGPCRDYRVLASWLLAQELREKAEAAADLPLRGHDVKPRRRPGRPVKGGVQHG
ncbi:MAG: ParA family protein, partial [Oscillospiraceae bacterium]|nr:ParA family protein [Oscillospiraceae bacterium]